MDKVREPIWDHLKLVAMLCVVMRHCMVQGGGRAYLWTPLMFAMVAFCFVSGRMYRPRGIKDTVVRYLWPCILFSVLIYLWGQFFDPALKGWKVPEAIIVGPAMWYLLALAVWQAATPILLRCFNPYGLFIVSVICACLAGYVPWIGIKFQLSRLICFYPFFVLGIAMKDVDPWRRIKKTYWIVLYLVVVAVFCILHQYRPGIVYGIVMNHGYGKSLYSGVVRLFVCSLGVVMTFCVIGILPRSERWFSAYGRRTMSVYLLHMFVVMPICYTLASYWRHSWIGYVLTLIVAPLLCLPFFSSLVSNCVNSIVNVWRTRN